MQESLPERIREEVRRFLECGLLRYGMVEMKCEECLVLSLIAFSCKKRGWCPSCTTRRAVEVALRLSSQLPFVAHRQWTLSLPRGLRLAVVKQPRVLKLVERALVRAVARRRIRIRPGCSSWPGELEGHVGAPQGRHAPRGHCLPVGLKRIASHQVRRGSFPGLA